MHMGASGWISIVEACDDLEVALLRAKSDAFDQRAFEDRWGVIDRPDEVRTLLLQTPQVPPELAEDQAAIIASHIEWSSPRLVALEDFLCTQDLVTKMDALRRVYGFEGTHSILDIESVQDLQEVALEERIKRFGETVPVLGRSQLTELLALVEARGTAVWLRYIDSSGAAKIGFVGVSGD